MQGEPSAKISAPSIGEHVSLIVERQHLLQAFSTGKIFNFIGKPLWKMVSIKDKVLHILFHIIYPLFP